MELSRVAREILILFLPDRQRCRCWTTQDIGWKNELLILTYAPVAVGSSILTECKVNTLYYF
jgi:acyl-coenzyme A synthetase/AMP-(fatty) acid ligase